MAAKSFLRLVAGIKTVIFGVQTSAGAGNAGDIPSLDDNGRLSSTMMPAGFGAETKDITASEALAAGDFVNLHDSSGLKMRKADGTTIAKRAHGYVLAAISNGASGTFYYGNLNNQKSGLTIGQQLYLSDTTPGATTATSPSAPGSISQALGVATATTEMLVEIQEPVQL